jgi:Ca2+-binding EF-hand superfamily protein
VIPFLVISRDTFLCVQVYQLFLEMDLNGDGIIDTKELRKGLKAFGYKLTDAEVQQLMLRMDLNHDGTVDFSELAASLVDWQQFQAVQSDWDSWLDRVFDRLDSDGSGFVDLQEIMRCSAPQLQLQLPQGFCLFRNEINGCIYLVLMQPYTQWQGHRSVLRKCGSESCMHDRS